MTKRPAAISIALALGLALSCGGADEPVASSAPAATSAPASPCDPAWARLFTPARPQLGRYEVCTTGDSIAALAGPGWWVEQVGPLDAFGSAGSFDRGRLTRLYQGRRATVARGYVQRDGRFEAVTLVSPHPNRELTALEPGTLVIRHIVVE